MSLFYRVCKSILSGFFRLCYHHRVIGVENLPEGPALLAANHTSFYDPPLIGVSMPHEIDFLARSSLFNHPIFCCLIQALHAHPLSGSINDYKSFKIVNRLLVEGKKVLIFPEGQRSYDGNFNPILPGTCRLAWRAKVPIVPIYVHTFDVWPRTRRFPKLHGRTACLFGNPIRCEEFEQLEKKTAYIEINLRLQKEWERLKDHYSSAR